MEGSDRCGNSNMYCDNMCGSDNMDGSDRCGNDNVDGAGWSDGCQLLYEDSIGVNENSVKDAC